MNHVTRLTFIFVALLVLAPTACRKKPPGNGNTMRAAFMTTLQLIVETKEIEKASEGKEDQQESAFTKVMEKTEAAHALALSVDDDFLRWVEPGLPNAFGKLRESLELRSKGMRRNDIQLQAKASELWLEWGEYWASNDEEVYKKLKVE